MVHTITLGTWAGNMWMSRTLSLQTKLSLSRGVGTGVNTWDICSSRTDGTLQAPVLVLSTSRAQEGEVVLAHCFLRKIIPATRIVFCKDGMELYNMKAQEDVVIYSMLLNISARSSGTYACGYQQRNESNWLRSSPLSTPLDLHVAGHLSISTAGGAPTGTCREGCQRQQHIPSQQMEATNYGEIQYATVVHFQRDKKNSKS
eukprot:XP_015155964.1 uncharacterized protein LOC107055458 isoform X3 [Gallus gallus]